MVVRKNYEKGIDFWCDIKYNLGVLESEVRKMSPRTGRPKVQNPKNIRYSVCLDAKTEEKLGEYCEKHQITKGEAIRKGIEMLLGEK